MRPCRVARGDPHAYTLKSVLQRFKPVAVFLPRTCCGRTVVNYRWFCRAPAVSVL